MSEENSLEGKRFLVASEQEDTDAVDESSFHKFTADDKWIEVISSPADSTAWQPPKNDGASLSVQTEQGTFLEYIFKDGRYNLVGEVTND